MERLKKTAHISQIMPICLKQIEFESKLRAVESKILKTFVRVYDVKITCSKEKGYSCKLYFYQASLNTKFSCITIITNHDLLQIIPQIKNIMKLK